MIIPILLGAVAIFVWSKLSPKAGIKEVAGEAASEGLFDKLKAGAAKVAAIVGGGVPVVTKAVAAIKTSIAAKGVAGGVAGGAAAAATVTTIGISALPAATVLPAGLAAMAPTTLASATFGVAPTVVGTGAGTSGVGAGVGGAAGGGSLLAGAAIAAAPLVIMPLFAKVLDWLFGNKGPDIYIPSAEELAQRKVVGDWIKAETAAGRTYDYDPKAGGWAE